jgi:hypothetical protein
MSTDYHIVQSGVIWEVDPKSSIMESALCSCVTEHFCVQVISAPPGDSELVSPRGRARAAIKFRPDGRKGFMGLSTSMQSISDSLSEATSLLASGSAFERLRFVGDEVGVYVPEVAGANTSRSVSFAEGYIRSSKRAVGVCFAGELFGVLWAEGCVRYPSRTSMLCVRRRVILFSNALKFHIERLTLSGSHCCIAYIRDHVGRCTVA